MFPALSLMLRHSAFGFVRAGAWPPLAPYRAGRLRVTFLADSTEAAGNRRSVTDGSQLSVVVAFRAIWCVATPRLTAVTAQRKNAGGTRCRDRTKWGLPWNQLIDSISTRFNAPDTERRRFDTASAGWIACRVARNRIGCSCGRLAQMVEHLVYTQAVGGSSPSPPMQGDPP